MYRSSDCSHLSHKLKKYFRSVIQFRFEPATRTPLPPPPPPPPPPTTAPPSSQLRCIERKTSPSQRASRPCSVAPAALNALTSFHLPPEAKLPHQPTLDWWLTCTHTRKHGAICTSSWKCQSFCHGHVSLSAGSVHSLELSCNKTLYFGKSTISFQHSWWRKSSGKAVFGSWGKGGGGGCCFPNYYLIQKLQRTSHSIQKDLAGAIPCIYIPLL